VVLGCPQWVPLAVGSAAQLALSPKATVQWTEQRDMFLPLVPVRSCCSGPGCVSPCERVTVS
jgi:hypothetical protein